MNRKQAEISILSQNERYRGPGNPIFDSFFTVATLKTLAALITPALTHSMACNLRLHDT